MDDGTALNGLRVVDFSNQRTGAQVSQTLADFGADVVLVEPPGGLALRGDAAWPLWGRGKRAIQLDLKDAGDLAVAQRLAEGADVVLETFRPGVAERFGLDHATLSAGNPRLIHASITGFGRNGPLAGLQGYEHIVQAKLGVFNAVEHMTHRPGPAFASTAFASYPATQLCLQAILAALYERETSGVGQKVETTLAQGLSVYDTFNWFSRVLAKKHGDGFTQKPRVEDGVPTGGLSFRLLVAMTKDGKWLQFSQTSPRLFRAMMQLFELDWMFDDPMWEMVPDFDELEKRREYWERLLTVVNSRTRDEWLAAFRAHPDVWGETMSRGAELLDHPQMLWNQMVHERDDPVLGQVRMPGPIVRLSKTPARLDRPPPKLGEHDARIRAEGPAKPPHAAPAAPGREPPLKGVTVIELGTYYAAPFGATLLAEMGARVIKLEQIDGDPHRNMLPFPELAGIKVLQGKQCVAVDLATDAGREIAHKIIAGGDIVLQSFRAGAAERLGLDEATLRKVNPDLIYQSSPGYGEDGPYGRCPAFAPTICAAAGQAHRNAPWLIPEGAKLTLEEIKDASLRIGAASSGGGNADGLSACTAATAMLLGLYARARGCGGQKGLTSMISSAGHALSEVMVTYQGRPEIPTVDEGLYGFSALYRLYLAADDWIFLAAPDDRAWEKLTAVLPGGAALAADPRFATAAGRSAADAALAAALAAIFARQSAAHWEQSLRAADIACVQVAPAPMEANYMDEGNVGRQCGFVTTGSHPILEDVDRLTPLVSFSRSATVAGDAGMIGQDTESVLRDFGYGDGDIRAMAGQGLILLG